MEASEAIAESAEAAGLHYVHDTSPGIRREMSGESFCYIHPKKGIIENPAELERIRSLAIPPAYRRVWICTDPKGHLQATGIDARGRKQYRYHPKFREVRDESKFHRMLEFGRALPRIRERVNRDLRLRGFPKPKVLAAVVYLLERSLIRVGNEEYAKQNQSYGLTTMQAQHAEVKGSRIEFHFRGKSKVWHEIEVHDARLARLIKKIQDLPGQELFHYMNDAGEAETVSSAEVNEYLHECSGEHFTAKDFRTWWGTLLALAELAGAPTGTTQSAIKRSVSAAMKNVSRQLGNTPTICRKCYVHPSVVKAYEKAVLAECWNSSSDCVEDPIQLAEKVLIELLERDTPPGLLKAS